MMCVGIFLFLIPDLPDRQATGIQGNNLVVEASPAGLMLADDLRRECALAVTGYIERQCAKIAFQRLGAMTVAGIGCVIGDLAALAVSQMIGHFDL